MPRKFWSGLILILVLYTAYYILFVETGYAYDHIARKARHFIKFGFLITVYIIGLRHLNYRNITWMKTIWHGIHLLGIFLLLLFGLYDWIIKMLPLNIKLTLISINEFLIAPTLFVVMGILNSFLTKNQNH